MVLCTVFNVLTRTVTTAISVKQPNLLRIGCLNIVDLAQVAITAVYSHLNASGHSLSARDCKYQGFFLNVGHVQKHGFPLYCYI